MDEGHRLMAEKQAGLALTVCLSVCLSVCQYTVYTVHRYAVHHVHGTPRSHRVAPLEQAYAASLRSEAIYTA
jgi:hypothetical protein